VEHRRGERDPGRRRVIAIGPIQPRSESVAVPKLAINPDRYRRSRAGLPGPRFEGVFACGGTWSKCTGRPLRGRQRLSAAIDAERWLAEHEHEYEHARRVTYIDNIKHGRCDHHGYDQGPSPTRLRGLRSF